MNQSKTEILTVTIDRIVEKLRAPLPSDELNYGWSLQLAQRWTAILLTNKEEMLNNVPIDVSRHNYARDLAFSGINPLSCLLGDISGLWLSLCDFHST